MELPDLIQKVRGTRTQAEFAASIGAKKQQVSDWERGVYKPSPDQLGAMGITLRYDLDRPTHTIERDEYVQA